MIDFETLGYKNITEDKPIHFSECLGPTTIEQHELLFRKMKEEGYQWDKNKKEVIKL